jgi:hypothetical protein
MINRQIGNSFFDPEEIALPLITSQKCKRLFAAFAGNLGFV